MLKTTLLFFATALCEIIGCFLPWLWLKQGASVWLLLPAVVSLAAFVWLLTLHPAASGRVYAAYGGVYIGVAILWLWAVDGIRPTAWDALGSLTQPLFAFGKLRRSEMAAMERYTQAAKTYEQTVLTAFADVEKALVAIATYRTQTERSCELVVSNDRIATMTQALYRSGLSDYLDVIDAERSLYQSQMELVNIAAQQYINYVNLCKALGGGW